MIKLNFKCKTFFFLLMVISSATSAMEDSCKVPPQENTEHCFSQPTFEVKMGYLLFSNSKMRKIYNSGGLDIQLCASYPLGNHTCRWTLKAYGAIEYFHRSGKSINGDQKTSVWSLPVNIGLKPVYLIDDSMQYYFAMGPRYLYIHQHNHSSYVYKNRSRNALGFFINTGLHYVLCDRLTSDVFGEYSFAKMDIHGKSGAYTKNIQIGGFILGAGIAYVF